MIQFCVIRGHSMEPFCQEGDIVVVNKMSYLVSQPRIEDTVAVRHPWENIWIVKRIREAYNAGSEQYYWVEGDNEQESSDSREFGWIPRRDILGKAFVIRL